MTRQVLLPDDIGAARVARDTVRDELASVLAQDDEFVDDTVLITSELVANAVRHGKPPFDLTIGVTQETVRITVTNGGADGEPHVEVASTDSGRGRGLAMVDALADEWGWERDADRITVWAVVALT